MHMITYDEAEPKTSSILGRAWVAYSCVFNPATTTVGAT